MAMAYPEAAIPATQVPIAAHPMFQHLLDIYAGEINKVDSVWEGFGPADFAFKPHPKSSSVGEVMKHELLSGRRFFAEFLGSPEPAPADVVPADPALWRARLRELAFPRLGYLASRSPEWWSAGVPFFDVLRERIWIFWRRVLHTAHHRTQLSVCLRLLNKPVPPVYGPTADATWSGADPTTSAASAGRRGPA